MAVERVNDARAFLDFLDAQPADGGEARSLRGILDLWLAENTPQLACEEPLQAIRDGLKDMYAGRTRPFEEFDREFRERHGLPKRS